MRRLIFWGTCSAIALFGAGFMLGYRTGYDNGMQDTMIVAHETISQIKAKFAAAPRGGGK